MNHRRFAPARILALAVAAAIGVAAALSLAGGASAQIAPQENPNSSMRYIGIDTTQVIADTELASGAQSVRGYTNVLTGPEWASGTRYIYFAVPDSERDIARVRIKARLADSFADPVYPTLNRIPGTRTLGATTFKVWHTVDAQAQSFSGAEIAIEQVSFASGCRTLAVGALPATGDASLPVCPDNDRAMRLQPIDAEVLLEQAVRDDPQILTIWTSGPEGRPRWIRDYITNVYDPDNPGDILDPRDLSNYETVEGRGRYITGAGERNDLFIGLRKPGTNERYTYGELTGVRVHVSPDNYYVQNFHGALYSAPSGGALGNRRLDLIDHPNPEGKTHLEGKKICNPLHIPYGASGHYYFGEVDPDNLPTLDSSDVPFTYYTATTPVCVIDRPEWKLLSGTPNASDSDLVPDLHLQFSIPDQWSDEDNRVWVGVAYLTENGTCTNMERQDATCDTAVSTWYETLPEAFIYRINSLGERCPIYQPVQSPNLHADDIALNNAYWQEECELASPTTAAFTGGEPIKIGFTLLDSADFDADPALKGRQSHGNILRWNAFDAVSIRAEASELTPRPGQPMNYEFYPSGQFRFIRSDGTKSDWKQSWLMNRDQLRYEALGSGFFNDSDPRWFDAFPVIEFLPTDESTAQLQVHFFNEGVELSDAAGFVKADDLPVPYPRVSYLSDGRIGFSAFGGIEDPDSTPIKRTGYATYRSLHPEGAIAIAFLSGVVSLGETTCDVSQQSLGENAAAGEEPYCLFDFSRQEAWEAAGGEGPVQVDALIKPIPMLYFPADSTDEQVMSVTVTSSRSVTVNGDTVNVVRARLIREVDYEGGLFDPPTRPSFSYAGITAALEQDADGIAAPGEQVPLTIGFQINAGADENASTMICTSVTLEPCRINIDPNDSYLRVSGPALWETGSDRLNIDGRNYKLKCSPTREIVATRDFGTTCYVVKADGVTRPKVLVSSDADEDVAVHASFAPVAGGTFHAFIRESDSDPWIPVRLRLREFGSYTLKVQQVKQLDSISLGRPPINGVVPTTAIPIGTKATKVRLGLFNENDLPSDLSRVSSITLTAIGGGSLSAYNCNQQISCTLRLTANADATAANNIIKAAEGNPALSGRIDFDFDAPSKAGEVTIRAVVVDKDSAQRFIESLVLIISGSAVELAATGDLPRVHSSATENDDRDRIEIPISATDANGNPAPLPIAASATVTGIGGAPLPAGSHTVAITCGAGRFNCKIVVTVTAGASSPLAAGAYTATVRGVGPDDTETMFSVAGPVDSISLEVPEDFGLLGNTVGVSARAVDKDGIPVADGTWITFNSTATRGGTFAAALLANPLPSDHDNDESTAPVRRAKTKNGVAQALIAIVGNGVSILSAASDNNKSTSTPIDTTDVPAYGEDAIAYGGDPVDFGSGEGPATGALATYRGVSTTRASAVLDLGPSGSTVVWLWNGVEWIRYGETDGEELPGSVNFTLLPGDTILFGAGS